MSEKKVSRRGYAKYAAAGIVVVAVAGAGAYYATRPSAPTPTPTPTPSPTPTPTPTPSPTPTPTPTKKYKAAGLFFGIVTDQAWNTVGWDAMTGLQDDLGWEIANSEKIYVPDAERVMRDYATSGYNFIIPWSGSYYENVLNIAPEFPDVSFHQFTIGAWPPENMDELPSNLQWCHSEQHPNFYATGALAALMSKTKKIGHVGAMAYPTSIASVNAYKQGALAVEPDIEVYKLWTGSWDDAALAKEATISLFDKGVDVVQHQCDLGAFGVFEAVKEYNDKGETVWALGNDRDQSYLAPGYVLTSTVVDYRSAMVEMGKAIIDGQLGGVQHVTIDAGRLLLAPLNPKIPEEIQTQVKEIHDQLVSGEIVVSFDMEESW